MPAKVKAAIGGSYITEDESGQKLVTRGRGSVNVGAFVHMITLPDVKAVFLAMKNYSGLRDEFNALGAALRAAHPDVRSFAIQLEDFPDKSMTASLQDGLTE